MKMKDKKAAQIAQKQAHKMRLQEAKNRRAAPDFVLPPPTRPERQRFLIVCEGLNTEPDYFRQFRQYFRLTAAEIIEVGGAGETIRVVPLNAQRGCSPSMKTPQRQQVPSLPQRFLN